MSTAPNWDYQMYWFYTKLRLFTPQRYDISSDFANIYRLIMLMCYKSINFLSQAICNTYPGMLQAAVFRRESVPPASICAENLYSSYSSGVPWYLRCHLMPLYYGCYVQDNVIYSSWFFKCNIILVHFHKIDVYYIVVILCSKIPDGKSLSALSATFND